MFTVNNKDIRKTLMALFWCVYCQLWTYFTPCSSVSIFNFESVIAGWEWENNKGTEANSFDWIHVICEAKFGNDP